MKKKLLMSLLLLTMIGTSMVFAQEDASLKMKFTNVNGGLSVAAMPGISGEVTIPDTYNGQKVVAVAVNGFKYCTGITGLTIPRSITEIGNSAFESCYNIIEINMGDGVITIGINAFKGCWALRAFKGANIGASVRTIRSSAFEGCRELRRIWIRESVQSIDDSAFSGCGNIERVNFQQADTRIGTNAFPANEALINAYKANGKGPYDRNGNTWTKGK